MKKLIIVLLSAFSLFSCAAEQPDLADWLERGVLIDTRTSEEFRAGAIEGAVLIPYEVIVQRIGSVVKDKETPILLYCRSGRRAGVAEKSLKAAGYSNVINLGGLQEAFKIVSENR